jgi:putative sigma-54 modulation protein
MEGTMKVTYTGKTKDFTPQLEKKVEEKLAKLGKLIEQRGEKEAHVSHRQERHLHKVDIQTSFYDHALLGVGENTDLTTAICDALEKLEKQIVKLRSRWRDTHRDPKTTRASKESGSETGASETSQAGTAKPAKSGNSVGHDHTSPRVYFVSHPEDVKPMTLEEALLVMDEKLDYMVYRDCDRFSTCVLLRRRDGHFDLIEA